MIGRIGEVLGLDAEGMPAVIGDFLSADQAPVEKVSGVELQPRLGGEDLETATRLHVRHPRRESRHRPPGSQGEGVIVAAARGDEVVDAGSESTR